MPSRSSPEMHTTSMPSRSTASTVSLSLARWTSTVAPLAARASRSTTPRPTVPASSRAGTASVQKEDLALTATTCSDRPRATRKGTAVPYTEAIFSSAGSSGRARVRSAPSVTVSPVGAGDCWD